MDIIRYRAVDNPDQIAFRYLTDEAIHEEILTYRQLDAQAIAIAGRLQSLGCFGERVLLMYPPGLRFISAFFGCLYAGAVAVPTYSPSSRRSVAKLEGIAQDCQAMAVLTNKSIFSYMEKYLKRSPTFSSMQFLVTDDEYSLQSHEWKETSIEGDALAFLQYTSGSTGKPKGVMVSHENIMHNESLIQHGFGHTKESVVVSWLPLFHDMGLIGNVLQPIYVGCPCILIPPMAFLQRPVRWLQAISQHRATSSGGPNFAYELCIKKIRPEQKQELDLSSWKVAYSGAETVRAETIERFVAAFASCGFCRKAFYPCYGMAEATLMISGGTRQTDPTLQTVEETALTEHRFVPAEEGQTLVGCGGSFDGQQIVIVHPETRFTCAENEVGEIWISGSSIAKGYWGRPELTEQTFRAHLADSEIGPFMRTGDLGFLHKRELFITGRLKDLVIVRGRNYYPQDIEWTVQKSHPALRPNFGAAFSVELDGEEKLIVVQEVERTRLRKLNLDEVLESIRQAVSLEHGLAISTIILLKPESIPKTSSGKVQRSACRKNFHNGIWKNIDLVDVEQKIQTQVKEIEFSLLYFSSNEAEFTDNKYRLFLEGAKFADINDFHAVWIPERHFHPFGGLYPEPCILGGVIANSTERIRIRPGSIVLPLQNPVRVAEQWSVVDNLSGGRVDISFARGWNPNDFVLAPDNYANRTQVMASGISTVQKLWRGESICLPNGNGKRTEIRIYPLPQQEELPTWITCTGGKERFIQAGAMGANILTALLFQSIEDLAEKITLYRKSRAMHGYDPSDGHVTLMVHTFIDSEMDFVQSKVRKPFIDYLISSVHLWRNSSENLDNLTESKREILLDYAFERYFHTAALFGTPSKCLQMVDQLKGIGVDEIACLIDFGIDTDSVLSNLEYLNQLRILANSASDPQTNSERHRVIHIWQNQSLAQINSNKKDVAAESSNDLFQNIGANLSSGQDESLDVVSTEQVEHNLALSVLQKVISQEIASFLRIDPQKVSLEKGFFSLGIDSLMAIEMIEVLEEKINISISATLLFKYPTISKLSEYLLEVYGKEIDRYISGCQEKSELFMYELENQTEIVSYQELGLKRNKQVQQTDLVNSKRTSGKL